MDDVTTGLILCISSTFLYGSAFVPLKGKNFGDGVYSLQLRSIVILLVGYAIFILNDCQFFPVVMVGGALWAIANLIVLPCVGQIGLGLTVLLYSFTNCLTNWLIGNYGFLGLTKARQPKNAILNYIGLMFLLFGGILMFFIKPNLKQPNLPTPTSQSSMTGMISGEKTDVLNQIEFDSPTTGTQMVNITVKQFNMKRILAVIGSLVAGFFYGVNVVPVIYYQDTFKEAPQNGQSYVMSHFSGIFATSSLIFIAYCIIKKNRPFVAAEITLASFASGLLWAIAQSIFIISVKHLSQAISGPIGSTFPACVASIWSVLYFKEIKGTRNLVFLFSSISITLIGVVATALSKTL
ncbi:hypothetical protein M3Y94_00259700 [Aphelenchoides besseyi]|nr:hypothetical protein M3Y94_00259700 [Aphelenchoides besseyi]KAI6236184.1 hypothetical protein M3Y95_00130700 [Aphelenchoides besseyi]